MAAMPLHIRGCSRSNSPIRRPTPLEAKSMSHLALASPGTAWARRVRRGGEMTPSPPTKLASCGDTLSSWAANVSWFLPAT